MNGYTYTELKDTRSGFGDGLTELGRKNKNVVALCADLTGSLKMNQFKIENPKKVFSGGNRGSKYDGHCSWTHDRG